MYIHVQLLTGYKELLWYECPADWNITQLIGSIVKVPLRTQQVPALILAKQSHKPEVPFALRCATSLEAVPKDPHYYQFISSLAQYYQIPHISLIRRIKQFLFQKEVSIDQSLVNLKQTSRIIKLTSAQQKIVDDIIPTIRQPHFAPALIHGVTGSGKTELYKAWIQEAIHGHKSTILLLPEVTLSLTFERRLAAELPDIPIIGFHSATSVKQKRLLWKYLLENKPIVIVGVHLPILLPISNLGLLLIDEEHETGYQEKKHPKINSKEAALMRAKQYNIPIILGSATPSITSLYNVKKRNWKFYQLKERFAGAFPKVDIVSLTDKKQRKNFWISNQLYTAIADRLSKQEQTILFLNRRGHSFFVQCKNCTNVCECPHCSVSLTLHGDSIMRCHYCEYEAAMPKVCYACKETEFLKKGIGTQQLVGIIQKLFPHARIARADLDSTKQKKEWEKSVADMQAGNIDILIGTQTITKGYHFPKVTLVGIIWADLNLHFPRYNAAECTLQQLVQVAGRAGRQSNESTVIVQTMDDHRIYEYLQEERYLSFYEAEIKNRTLLSYPPLQRLAEIELKHTNEATLHQDAERIATELYAHIKKKSLTTKLLGPAKPPVHKIKNWYFRTIFLKEDNITTLIELYQYACKLHATSLISFNPNPLN